MKMFFSISLLLIYFLAQQSNAETYITKIVCNHKKELFCHGNVDKISFNDSNRKENSTINEVFRFVNKTLNKTEEELPLSKAFNFVMQYRKGGALINLGTPNPRLFKNDEKSGEMLSQNFSSRGKGTGKGLIVKVISISF